MSTFNKRKILVTGGTGFLGGYVCNLLSLHNELIVLKRSCSDISRINQNKGSIKFYDIDSVQIKDIFSQENINTIIHCATAYGRDSNQLTDIIKTNLSFPLEMIEEAIVHKVKKFINIDSFFNNGSGAYSYLAPYTLTKKQLIEWLKIYQKDIKIINLRVGHIFGALDSPKKFIPWFIQKLVDKSERIELTEGNQLRDFVYVKDVAGSIDFVLNNFQNSNTGFESYDVGSGNIVSLRFFLENLKEIFVNHKLASKETILDFGAIPHRDGEIMQTDLNTKKLEQQGWQASYTHNKAISDLAGYISSSSINLSDRLQI